MKVRAVVELVVVNNNVRLSKELLQDMCVGSVIVGDIDVLED